MIHTVTIVTKILAHYYGNNYLVYVHLYQLCFKHLFCVLLKITRLIYINFYITWSVGALISYYITGVVTLVLIKKRSVNYRTCT